MGIASEWELQVHIAVVYLKKKKKKKSTEEKEWAVGKANNFFKLWCMHPALQSCAEDAPCTAPATEQELNKRLKGQMGLSLHVMESRSLNIFTSEERDLPPLHRVDAKFNEINKY